MRITELVYDIVLSILVGALLKFMLVKADLDLVDTFVWKTLSSAMISPVARKGSREATALLISDHYYLHGFKDRSPLDRDELRLLISSVSTLLPSSPAHVVAIDLDLSPTAESDATINRQGAARALKAQGALDEALIGLALKARVILVCPLRKTPLLAAQLKWADGLFNQTARSHPLGRGIEFASATVRDRMGAVLDYSPDAYTLGARAGRTHLAMLEGDKALVELTEAAPPRNCLPQGDPQTESQLASGRSTRIEHDAFSRVTVVSLHSADASAAFRSPEVKDQSSPRLLIIGGQYHSPGDEFRVVTDPKDFVPGAFVHAAISVSERPDAAEYKNYKKLIKLGVDIAAIVGVLFVGAWLKPRISRLMEPRGAVPARGVPSSAWLKILWGPHAAHGGWKHAEMWLRWLCGVTILLLLLPAFVFSFGAVIVVLNTWHDFVTVAIVAWFKVVAGITQELLERFDVDAGALAADSPDVAARWVWASVLTRAAVVLCGAFSFVQIYSLRGA